MVQGVHHATDDHCRSYCGHNWMPYREVANVIRVIFQRGATGEAGDGSQYCN